MKKLLIGLTTGLFLAGAIGIASATTINVDFGNSGTNIYSGTGVAADLGTQWNGLDFDGGTNLMDSFGVATGIGVTTGASRAWDDGGNALLSDRIFVAGTWDDFNVDLSGLNDLSTYDLYLYGSNAAFASTYTSGGVSDYALGVQTNPWVLNDNYALLSNLSSASGLLSFNVDRYGSNSGAAVIGGFQLVETAFVPESTTSTPVPEPTTMLLFGTGLAGLATVGRRRRK